MPERDYKCTVCGEKFSYLSLDKDDKPKCPECGNKKLLVLPSAFKVIMR